MSEFQLNQIPQGGVRCVFTDEPWSFSLRHLSPETLWPHWRYAAWGLSTDSPINWSIYGLLENSLHQLARLAASIWPYWYGDSDGVLRHTATTTQIAAVVQKCHPEPFLKTPPEGIYLPWLKAARECCIGGRLPLLPRYARTLQAYQLAQALTPADLLLLLICDSPELCAGDLRNLGRAAEWVAAHTQARLLLVLPFNYRYRTELDSVNYQALVDVVVDRQVNDIAARMPDPPEESSRLWLDPVIGRPHPFSEGEQLLFRALATDARLCQLFEYNVWVDVRSGRRFLVDLLWRKGWLVVEVDGYRFHSDRISFARDRQRDYELIVSNYTVLRLTHTEVMQDVQQAVQKIHDVVCLQTKRCLTWG